MIYDPGLFSRRKIFPQIHADKFSRRFPQIFFAESRRFTQISFPADSRRFFSQNPAEKFSRRFTQIFFSQIYADVQLLYHLQVPSFTRNLRKSAGKFFCGKIYLRENLWK
ncbi:MAG: hypothetical protein DYG98_23485 [Haliscomenobacteraceae bacterium CHB4]|nr:hypothetical protein [Haliscomenobacteraceae bacterium CHB4]